MLNSLEFYWTHQFIWEASHCSIRSRLFQWNAGPQELADWPREKETYFKRNMTTKNGLKPYQTSTKEVRDKIMSNLEPPH